MFCFCFCYRLAVLLFNSRIVCALCPRGGMRQLIGLWWFKIHPINGRSTRAFHDSWTVTVHADAITSSDCIKINISAHNTSMKMADFAPIIEFWLIKLSNISNAKRTQRGIDFNQKYAQRVRWLTASQLDQHIDDEPMPLIASFLCIHLEFCCVISLLLVLFHCPHLYTCERAFVTIIRVHHFKNHMLKHWSGYAQVHRKHTNIKIPF